MSNLFLILNAAKVAIIVLDVLCVVAGLVGIGLIIREEIRRSRRAEDGK